MKSGASDVAIVKARIQSGGGLSLVTDYATQLTPRPYQAEALQRMNGRQAFALTMAMRTGKTKVLLDDFGQLERAGHAQDLLVIAPAGVYRTWEGEINKHLSIELLSRLKLYTWHTAKSNNKSEKLLREQFLECDGPRILLMNVEALSTVKLAREYCSRFLERCPLLAMIAVDESTIIKSPKAQRTKFINQHLAHLSKYRRILSGLPTPKSPLDLYCQFEFLDPTILGFGSYRAFQVRYAIMRRMQMGGRWFDVVDGYQNVEELQHKIEPHCYRVEFRPNIPSTYTQRDVPLTGKQEQLYRELKEYATARINEESHVTATVIIAQIMRLHQVLCGWTVDESGAVHEVPEHKTAQLLEILEDYNGKAVIWCSYDYNIERLSVVLREQYGKQAVARFWGGNPNVREAEEAKFRTDPQCRFMLATAAAGGRGRTWDVADLVIYYSSTFDLEHRDQSEQRVHNTDKLRQVDYIDLIAPGTVETKILHVLRNKLNMAAIITGDAWKEWIV
jgi:SNF2 family DNA or RNA helicase